MNDSNIILSSRVRLARNLDGMPFRGVNPAQISPKTMEALRATDSYILYSMAALNPLEQTRLVERHLISKELIDNGGTAIIRSDNKVSVMIGEEDHIREQCILPGPQLKEAYGELKQIDKTLGGAFKFAYDKTYGYLTSCLTNVGTGMRASVMMFLPALSLTGSLSRCISGVTRLNMAVRGVFGEGSKAEGYVYQISNQKTLGITENDIVSSVENVVSHIVESELRAREALMQSNPAGLTDKILRSFGLLSNCYMISKSEFMDLIAFVKLGIYYNILDCSDYAALEDLITEVQPASLCLSQHRRLDEGERDKVRASMCQKLNQIINRVGG
ncbi:MAG: ATP--guanido phosphotransferase [Clostridiales bacterium]|nr:ATP--guanido phosphotransferase [Clostridiales bacterium]